MFYKLVKKFFVVGSLYFGRFWNYFGIFLIFPLLQRRD